MSSIVDIPIYHQADYKNHQDLSTNYPVMSPRKRQQSKKMKIANEAICNNFDQPTQQQIHPSVEPPNDLTSLGWLHSLNIPNNNSNASCDQQQIHQAMQHQQSSSVDGCQINNPDSYLVSHPVSITAAMQQSIMTNVAGVSTSSMVMQPIIVHSGVISNRQHSIQMDRCSPATSIDSVVTTPKKTMIPSPSNMTDENNPVGPMQQQMYVNENNCNKTCISNVSIKDVDSMGHNNSNKPNIERPWPKPVYSYSCLISMALKNSNTGKLPVSDIYKYIQENFPYFLTAPDGWKNSVRHNLSLNKTFMKKERPEGTSHKKGSLWAMSPDRLEVIEKEIDKLQKKYADDIRASMKYPELFDCLWQKGGSNKVASESNTKFSKDYDGNHKRGMNTKINEIKDINYASVPTHDIISEHHNYMGSSTNNTLPSSFSHDIQVNNNYNVFKSECRPVTPSLYALDSQQMVPEVEMDIQDNMTAEEAARELFGQDLFLSSASPHNDSDTIATDDIYNQIAAEDSKTDYLNNSLNRLNSDLIAQLSSEDDDLWMGTSTLGNLQAK